MALKKDGDKKPVHFNIEIDDYIKLQDRAKEENKSACDLARIIMNRYVSSYEGELNE